MKRSELLDAIEDAVSNISMTTSAAEDADCIVSIVEAKLSPAWEPEPEVPEVLWEAPNPPGGWHAFQILSDGSVRSRGPSDAGKWRKHSKPLHPIHAELARRLLEERKQQQALDEHNDKLEKEVGSLELHLDQRIADHQDRLDALEESLEGAHDRLHLHDQRLTRVKEDLLLLRGQTAHLDEREAADYLSTQERLAALERKVDQLGEGVVDNVNCLDRRIDLLESQPTPGVAGDPPAGAGATQREASSRWVQVDREVFDRLLALWRLWGPEGELRTKLTGADVLGMHYGYGEYFRRLRSELLALPDEVKP